MDIFFQSKKLEKIASDPRKCLKELGQTRSELFQKRLEIYIEPTPWKMFVTCLDTIMN